MTAAESQIRPAPAAQGGGELLIRRVRFCCGMAVAAAIFWYVGWPVTRPLDPAGPVSLLLVRQGVVTLAELLGLAVAASGLAVAICGTGSADRGPLAIAVGLAVMGLRGGQLDGLVLYRLTLPPTDPASLNAFPTWALIAECWLWMALIAVGFVVGRWVDGWFGPPPAAGSADRPLADHTGDVRQGAAALLLTVLVTWAVYSFAIGEERHAVLKGQIYFAVAVSFLAGGLAAHSFFRSGGRVWAMVAVPIVAILAYVVGSPSEAAVAAARESGTYLVLRPIARPLPLEFAALGAIGVLIEADAMESLRAMFGLPPKEGREG